jgi:O-methyltransferase involved in polyketide biosynthesis
MAEGVFMYLEQAQVKQLVLMLRDRFPGSELVFDAFSPLHVRVSNRQVSTATHSFRFRWGTWTGRRLERWGDGIRLLDDWGYFDQPEPRLAGIRWMRHFWVMDRIARIYHFGLGKTLGWC